MDTKTFHQIQVLSRMTVGELRETYLELFGEETRSFHRDFLRKRIAWRIQARAEGTLSERARRRAEELADDADLRVRTPRDPVKCGRLPDMERSTVTHLPIVRDHRLPPPGTFLTREFKGRNIAVKVLDSGFRYENRQYKSLSSIAREITGTKWNGFLFFGIIKSTAARRNDSKPERSIQ